MLDALSPAGLEQLERVLGARLHVEITPAEERSNQLAFLMELQAAHGRTPQRKLYDQLRSPGSAKSQTLVKKHGSWIRACRAATAERERLGQRVEQHHLKPLRAWKNPTRGQRRPANYTVEEIIRAVLTCSAEIGRLPTSNAYYDWAAAARRRARQLGAPPPRIPTQRSVERHFASWDEVREAVQHYALPMASSTDPKRAAENALWHALQERREKIRADGLTFSERQHHQLRQAWEAGTLIDDLNRSMENYKSPGDPYYKTAMAHAMKNGHEIWEEILLHKREPWSPYISPKAKLGARKIVDDTKAFAAGLP